jgi:3-keto-5-aminohexanoate cleavage enzyme
MGSEYEDKVVITAALAGAATMKEQNPAVPYMPEEFIEESVKCYEAGAAIVHIHARKPTGWATSDLKILGEIVHGIRKECDILINLSTAVGITQTDEERIHHIPEFKPEMASLNTNSMNFALANWKTGEILFDWIFKNPFELIIKFAKIMRENGVKPELEVYDIGHVNNTLLLDKQGIFEHPLHYNFVFGVAGGIPFTPENLIRFRQSIPQDASWMVCGVGPAQFPAAAMATIMGGHIRVGLEDNIHISKGVLAKGSYEQVEKAVKIAALHDRKPATVDEAREIFHLRKK